MIDDKNIDIIKRRSKELEFLKEKIAKEVCELIVMPTLLEQGYTGFSSDCGSIGFTKIAHLIKDDDGDYGDYSLDLEISDMLVTDDSYSIKEGDIIDVINSDLEYKLLEAIDDDEIIDSFKDGLADILYYGSH